MQMDENLRSILKDSLTRNLTKEESEILFNKIMDGSFSDIHLSAILASMSSRGETIEELIGATKAMREHSTKIVGGKDVIDIVGTGGDGKGTLNISTASAIVVSGSGVRVAKHGNRNISSRSGAANILESLGIDVMMKPEVAQRCLDEIGICFMMAPVFHPAMKNVMPVRNELGIRTIFNVLGPMTNPAEVKKQLTGAFSKELLEPMARTLLALETETAWLVHGNDGTDEIAISDLTNVVELKDRAIRKFTLNPVDYGFKLHCFEGLIGGSPDYNATQLKTLLEGKTGVYRDSVLLNSAAALYIAGVVKDLNEGIFLATKSIDEGKALNKLTELRKMSSSKGR